MSRKELPQSEIDALNSVLEMAALRAEARKDLDDAKALRAGKLTGVLAALKEEPREG